MLKKKKKIFVFYALLLGMLMVPMGAAADDELMFTKTFTSITPVFMSGHDGDMSWIEGFTGTGDISMAGEKVGTLTVTLAFTNPPMNYVEKYEYAQMKLVNTITNVGTFEVNATALLMSSSAFITDGSGTLSWSGSISNATESLSSLVGLSAGTAQVNMLTGSGTGTELILYRLLF